MRMISYLNDSIAKNIIIKNKKVNTNEKNVNRNEWILNQRKSIKLIGIIKAIRCIKRNLSSSKKIR